MKSVAARVLYCNVNCTSGSLYCDTKWAKLYKLSKFYGKHFYSPDAYDNKVTVLTDYFNNNTTSSTCCMVVLSHNTHHAQLMPNPRGALGSERVRHAGPCLELRAAARSLPHMTNL